MAKGVRLPGRGAAEGPEDGPGSRDRGQGGVVQDRTEEKGPRAFERERGSEGHERGQAGAGGGEPADDGGGGVYGGREGRRVD